MIRTVVTLCAVLAMSLFLHQLHPFPGESYSVYMMVVDLIAATVILIRPAGRMQSLIGLSFLLQIGFYAGRLLNGDRADLDLFWWGLSVLALLQLALLAGWWFYERVPWRRLVRGRGPVPRPAHREGVEG